MVLQKRRGLKLLLLMQGDLCAALGKSCCFYANHPRVVKNTLQELKVSLLKRQGKKYPPTEIILLFPQAFWGVTMVNNPNICHCWSTCYSFNDSNSRPCIITMLIKFIRSCVSLREFLILCSQYTVVRGLDTSLISKTDLNCSSDVDLEKSRAWGWSPPPIFRLEFLSFLRLMAVILS